MKLKKRVKHKALILFLSFQLIGLSVLPFVNAATSSSDEGFIIQADRVIGENMKVTIVSSETSRSSGKPMLRFTYDSAQIYGMKLTKRFNTPNGPVSLTMKASGPVHMKGMTVDASNVSFNGACLYALKVIPDAGLDNVTMVAHYMNAENSSLSNLKMETVNGDGGVSMPGKLKILEDLSAMPFEQMKREIARISSGNLPLTCEEAQDDNTDSPAVSIEDGAEQVGELIEEITNPVSDITDPVTEIVEDVTDPLKDVVDTVKNPVKDVVDVVDKVTDPVKDIVDKVTTPIRDTVKGPVKETVDKVAEPVDEIVQKTTKPVLTTVKKATEPVTKPVVETVDKVALTTCQKLSEANGVITKELGLEMIDKALKEGKTLEQLCPTDKTLTERLLKWETGLLDSLGLLSLLGLKNTDPEVNLKKLRDVILKAEDGSVIKP
ncbi:hypothetical protein [Mesobacillus harenae]|uniref:hypothetical protein n=1 Tax=Mesobacillus harenae TaxID=2213203 RepID=UPI00158066F9|nr:hypothetical protein [Mesobacillus harenae]